MKLIGMCRLGRDVEVRYSNDGTPVANVVAVWNYGKKDAEGNQASQWVDLALWGERAEKLSPYMLKGQQLFIVASDVRVEMYEKRDGGSGAKLVGRVDSVEFGERPKASDGQAAAQPAAAAAPAPKAAAAAKPKARGFDDLDDDIPF